MKSHVAIIILLSIFNSTLAQSVIGKWKTIDDNTGEPRSLVDIYEREGKIYGKITKLFPKIGEDPDPVCDDCDPEDSRYLKKIIGMEIIESLTRDDEEYGGGYILDPENGKVFRCKIWVEGNLLKVRGYLGPFYRTQSWLKTD
ncbi:MAG: DUF2147 domain-containing protein [Bacteroidota bacterium]